MHRLLLSAALVAGLAAPALSQETRTSAAAKFDGEFTASDLDKDGSLSRAEVEARIGRMKIGAQRSDPDQAKQLSALWFTRADANRDGKVSRAEAQALLAATFKRYDANGDGKIGTGERAAAKAGVKRDR